MRARRHRWNRVHRPVRRRRAPATWTRGRGGPPRQPVTRAATASTQITAHQGTTRRCGTAAPRVRARRSRGHDPELRPAGRGAAGRVPRPRRTRRGDQQHGRLPRVRRAPRHRAGPARTAAADRGLLRRADAGSRRTRPHRSRCCSRSSAGSTTSTTRSRSSAPSLATRNLPGTVLRLPMVYGPGDPLRRFYPVVKRILDGRRVLLFSERHGAMARDERVRGGRGSRYRDCGDAVAVQPGRIFNVGEPDTLTELEWAERDCTRVWRGTGPSSFDRMMRCRRTSARPATPRSTGSPTRARIRAGAGIPRVDGS